MSKREMLKWLLSALGITALRWRALPPGLYVLNFHRIGNPADSPFDREVFSCSVKQFHEYLRLIKERFEVIDLERLRAIIEGRSKPGRRPLALITFDDGYIDNYQLAFPVLKQCGMTACFFIPTAFVGSDRFPWWDEIAWIIRNATVQCLTLDGQELAFELRSETLERTIRQVLRLAKQSPDMAGHIEVVRQACRPLGSIQNTASRLFMSWSEIREMGRAGMDFGSHSHTHPILSHLSVREQAEELATSKAVLESELGRVVDAVAYPVGGSRTYSSETREAAESVGYRLGFSFKRGRATFPIQAPLEIPRYGAGAPDLRATLCYAWYRG